MSSPWAHHWQLDPEIILLNHGSFGACPKVVLEAQQSARARLESNPMQFFLRDLEPELDAARTALGLFVGADPAGLAFVANATTGVNTVLRSLRFAPGDEILVTDHAYPACRNALDDVAARGAVRVVVASIPFPIDTPERATEAILSAVGRRTRLALLDHVTSPTALIMPLEQIVPELHSKNIDVLVDGAHAPGMLPVDIQALGVAYYTANCHKWICAPKGAAFLWVREDRRNGIRPLVVSHGATSKRRDRSRFLLEFDWVGTDDPTAYLAVPMALRSMESLLPGGWPELRRHNHELVLAGRRRLCEALGVDAPAPEAMIGSLASIPLPPGRPAPNLSPAHSDALQQSLAEQYRIEVPVIVWPRWPARLLRISAQLYNDRSQYERLAGALRELSRA